MPRSAHLPGTPGCARKPAGRSRGCARNRQATAPHRQRAAPSIVRFAGRRNYVDLNARASAWAFVASGRAFSPVGDASGVRAARTTPNLAGTTKSVPRAAPSWSSSWNASDGGGGNRTRVRGRTGRASTSVVRLGSRPTAGGGRPTGGPVNPLDVALWAIDSPAAPSPIVGACRGLGPNHGGRGQPNQ